MMFLLACAGFTRVDLDGDGLTVDDCDDRSAAVYPGARDAAYDGVDANCDGSNDYDADSDGHMGEPEGDDCDDANVTVHPDAIERCDPGEAVDHDCDGDTMGCVLQGRYSVNDADVSWEGRTDRDMAGHALAVLADGDGALELAVGAPQFDADGADANEGGVFVVSHRAGGGVTEAALRWWQGGEAGGRLGTSLAVASDGATLLIGASGRSYLEEAGPIAGAVYLVGDGSLGAAVRGDEDGEEFGWSLAVIDEGFAVGAPSYAGESEHQRRPRGRVYGWDTMPAAGAPADWRIVGEGDGDGLGGAVCAVELDGDGDSDELAIGALGADGPGGVDVGAVYLFDGARSSSAVGADRRIWGESGGPSEFGAAVAPAGDVDGDGYADLLVGSPGWSDTERAAAGRAYVVLGSWSGTRAARAAAFLTGVGGENHAGTSVASAGDANGDGHADVLVGASGTPSEESDQGAGAAYLVWGPFDGALELDVDASAVFLGDRAQAGAGAAFAVGDLDGEGTSDIVVGADARTATTIGDAGHVYLFLSGIE